jgi:hypothetical protein
VTDLQEDNNEQWGSATCESCDRKDGRRRRPRILAYGLERQRDSDGVTNLQEDNNEQWGSATEKTETKLRKNVLKRLMSMARRPAADRWRPSGPSLGRVRKRLSEWAAHSGSGGGRLDSWTCQLGEEKKTRGKCRKPAKPDPRVGVSCGWEFFHPYPYPRQPVPVTRTGCPAREFPYR